MSAYQPCPDWAPHSSLSKAWWYWRTAWLSSSGRAIDAGVSTGQSQKGRASCPPRGTSPSPRAPNALAIRHSRWECGHIAKWQKNAAVVESKPRLHPVPYAIANIGTKRGPAVGRLQTVAKYARNPPHNHVTRGQQGQPHLLDMVRSHEGGPDSSFAHSLRTAVSSCQGLQRETWSTLCMRQFSGKVMR